MTIEQILKAPEGRMLEFKRELPKDRMNLLKTIVGFSNGSGGHIYIGVNDDRSVCGIKEEPFELEQRLSSLIYDSIAPIPAVFYQTISIEDKIVFSVKVLPGANKPYFLNQLGPEEGTFIRVGSTNRKADSYILSELHRQARNVSLDSEVETNFDCNMIDMEVLRLFLSWRELDVDPSIDYLVKNGLARRYNHTCHPTIGGLLLFSSRLPDTYEYAGFRVSRFKHESRSDLIHSESVFTGLLNMPQRVMDLILLFLERNVRIEGLRRKEEYDIPLQAIRETVVNAICHRDYSITGAYNKVDIFSDRIEVISPGVLPTGITLEDLGLGTSEIRNRYIAKTFHQAGFIEQLGTGIMRIRQLCRRNLLTEPKFEEVGSFFKATLFRPRRSLPEEIRPVFDLLKEQGAMGSKEIAKYLEVHQNTALKRLRWLEQEGLVHRQGRGTKVRYVV